jgi:hypothetical protein
VASASTQEEKLCQAMTAGSGRPLNRPSAKEELPMKNIAIALAAAAALSACGGGSGSDSKNLFSLWTNTQTGALIELSGGDFGVSKINLYTLDATRCICDLSIIGNQGAGNIAITGCISVPYNQQRNPQCEALNGTGNYTKTTDTLTITSARGSATFR